VCVCVCVCVFSMRSMRIVCVFNMLYMHIVCVGLRCRSLDKTIGKCMCALSSST